MNFSLYSNRHLVKYGLFFLQKSVYSNILAIVILLPNSKIFSSDGTMSVIASFQVLFLCVLLNNSLYFWRCNSVI